ncbi:metal ABC transporter ATP-binding protein [Paenibacillus sp. CMAA1364]
MKSVTAQDCHQHIIELDNVSFSYRNQSVLSDVNFAVKERDFVGIIGSNGAGKTTLMKLIVGLLPMDKGSIKLFGTPIQSFKDWERIGYVPQKNNFNPLFPATVREVVLSGMYNNKSMFRRVSPAMHQQCDDALEVMRIQDIANKRVGELSGGQQQRVFLARALINHPDLLVLDEPTVGIDAATQASFFELITHMHAHHHMTFLMVSHDLDMIEGYLGKSPKQKNGNISLFVRHSHDLQNCDEHDLEHSVTTN